MFWKSFADPLPSVVQAYIQPYSFGGRIKLIICQIKHELSVAIHEISVIVENTLDGGPYITYIIGHYNPSVRIIDLVSYATYFVRVNFIHKWRDLQFI